MEELDILRKEIDDIDGQLVELFEKRMEIASRIGAVKQKMDMPVLDSGREEEVIKKAINKLKNKELSQELELFFRNLMDLSKKIQRDRMRKAED